MAFDYSLFTSGSSGAIIPLALVYNSTRTLFTLLLLVLVRSRIAFEMLHQQLYQRWCASLSKTSHWPSFNYVG